jgi:serine/threonine protein kinase/tetratricopeptide (TPR) repeat protein
MEQLGRYQLSARIATGGMAEVFLARSEGVQGFSRTVVIKRLLPHLARDPVVVEMFLNEARLTGRLDHPNIVQVFDLGQDHQQYYIAMEFLDGRSLSEVSHAAKAQGGMLPTPFTLKVFSEALAGLHHAHMALGEDGRPLSIVHRDFNPDNILVTYDGRVKVVDFGIAKAQIHAAASTTEPGTLKGKYFYMSPEMVLGNPLDRRADLFAAGVSLYELLCTRRPFDGDTPNAILSAIAYGKPLPPRSLNPAISPELEALINHCLERDPEARPSTGLDIKMDLDQLLAHEAQFGQPEIASLMELLFPKATDPERSRIRELRQLDPSSPGTPAPLLSPPSAPPQVTGRAREGGPALPVPEPRPTTPMGVLPVALSAALVLGLGAVVAWRFIPHLPQFAAKDPAAAQLEQLKSDVATHPGEGLFAVRYAEALMAQSQEDEATEVLDAYLAAAEKPGAPAGQPAPAERAHLLRGDLYQKKRFGQKAQDEYQKALKLRTDDPVAWEHLGDLQQARGDLPAARDAIGRAQALKPNDRGLAMKLAAILRSGNDWDKAIALLSPLANRSPQDGELHAELGFALLQSGNDQRALNELMIAERINAKSSKTQTYLGFTYYKQGKPQKAQDAYRAAIAAAETPLAAVPAHIALGQILGEHGDRDEARKEYEAALKADPANVDAKESLKKL